MQAIASRHAKPSDSLAAVISLAHLLLALLQYLVRILLHPRESRWHLEQASIYPLLENDVTSMVISINAPGHGGGGFHAKHTSGFAMLASLQKKMR
jgi:hypothetical protein